jgi:uncharacterized membrane protein YozB (DUF420 family)
MDIRDLPTLNATLNAISSIFLILGYIAIRRQNITTHKHRMIAAVIASALFLVFYLVYHAHVGSTPYPHYDWTRPLYFAVLIPHVILAAIMVPFILMLLWYAFRQRFDRHRRLARWVWPVWIFVSFSGVIVYVMLYRM